MGFSVWDQFHLPRHSLLEPGQETGGHKNKLGIVKPKAAHHRRLPPMAWSLFLKALLESDRDRAD